MARASTQYVCQECGACYPKWAGKCDACDAWNTLAEEASRDTIPKGMGAAKGRTIELTTLSGTTEPVARLSTTIHEFDRVCGGGLVPGSVLLVGGDPGIGKSTLLLQIAAQISKSTKCCYISGEEGIEQVRLRAKRLQVESSQVHLGAAINIRDILTTVEGPEKPDVLIIDSIQTMYLDTLDSAPGTVGQVRACAQELIRTAKNHNITVILVGHVTKEGNIAGPRVLEHMVDAVLYFEGDRGHQYRILRTVKNRFGPTDEIGVFEMTELGLAQVDNPSALFLADHQEEVSGSSVYAGLEGSRPLLVEIQSLVAPSTFSTPRRAVIGWDQGRLSMVLAVLETRCGVSFAQKDVYLNVAGGLKIQEPAADLAVCVALLSSLTDRPIPKGTVIFGEIGLGGEIRPASQKEARLKEASKLGFHKAWCPRASKKIQNASISIVQKEIRYVHALLEFFYPETTERTATL